MIRVKLQIGALRVESFAPGVAQARSDTIPPQGIVFAGTYLMNCFYTEQNSCTC